MASIYAFGRIGAVGGLVCLLCCVVSFCDEPSSDTKPRGGLVDNRASELQIRNALNHRAIEKALAEHTQLEFIETPLADVIEYLEDRHGIQIELDTRALDLVGIGSDTPINRDLNRISLRSALRLMLRDLELTYMIRDEVLMITTPEVADEHLDLKIYDLSDLASDEGSAKEFLIALQSLSDEKESRRMAIFRGQLVVRGSHHQHERLESFLSMLRANLSEDQAAAAHPLSRWVLGSVVDLSGAQLVDDDLSHLKRQRHIVSLDLSETRIGDKGIAHLSGLADLKQLRLRNTRITDAAIGHFKGLTKLEDLDLSDTQITDTGLEQLAGLKQLRSLNVGISLGHRTGITKVSVEKLRKALSDCQIKARYERSKPTVTANPDPFGGGGANPFGEKDPSGADANPFGEKDPFKR